MKHFFLPALLVLFVSCEKYKPFESEIHGLASPIRLQAEQTTVYLGDFFHKSDFVADSVIWPEGLTASPTDSGATILNGRPQTTWSFLTVYAKGVRYEIPIQASAKQVYEFSIQGLPENSQNVYLFGSFNAWNRGALKMEAIDGAYKAKVYLQAGVYEYKLFVDGREMLDPSNNDSVANGIGGYNNVLRLLSQGDGPVLVYAESHGKNFITLNSIPQDQELLAFWDNHRISPRTTLENGKVVYNLPVPNPAFRSQRSHLRIYTARNSQVGNDLLIPLELGKVVEDPAKLTASDWHSARMYFLMIDRFANGRSDNDKPVPDTAIHPRANYQGGDIAGLSHKIDEGFFDSLKLNTIWISPISKNPEGAWGLWDKGGVRSKFSGYHGYWPISNVVPDYRFATPDEVDQMLEKAHGKSFNVLLDYVANHVHQEHPIYQKHPDWATELHLPDGSLNTERWDEHRLTTWFDTFMPTLELRRQEIVDPMTDSALVWVNRYAFDGYRHDATKHIHERYWRTLTAKLKQQKPDKHIYQIGETYGSPELIASYVGSGLLDAQFDFNVYDASVNAFSGIEAPETALPRLKELLEQSLLYYGHANLMGYISGNQDRPRFISIASGDVKLDGDVKLQGWTRETPMPNAESYKRLALLHAFNFAIPGIPVIYYGDEIGLHGAGDPDNRKMMLFENLLPEQKVLRETVVEIAAMRQNQMALNYGSVETSIPMPGILRIERKYFDQVVVVFLNTTEQTVSVEMSSSAKTHFNGQILRQNNKTLLSLPALSFEYLTLP